MTVKELITLLQVAPPDYTIMIPDFGDDYREPDEYQAENVFTNTTLKQVTIS